MPPAYVKPYVKRGKNDAADAEACCEAVGRPTMRFVPVKRLDDQAVLVLHKTRDLLVKQRTQQINALRGHLAEFGLVAPKGREGVAKLIVALRRAGRERVPEVARPAFALLTARIAEIERSIAEVERAIVGWHTGNELSKLAASAAGVGPLTASAVVAKTGGDLRRFRSGRHFSAWLGGVPRQTGTGGKVTLGPISKRGDRYLRRLLVLGATSLLRRANNPDTEQLAWLKSVRDRRGARVATIAQANKTARILWAVLTTGVPYKPTPLAKAA